MYRAYLSTLILGVVSTAGVSGADPLPAWLMPCVKQKQLPEPHKVVLPSPHDIELIWSRALAADGASASHNPRVRSRSAGVASRAEPADVDIIQVLLDELLELLKLPVSARGQIEAIAKGVISLTNLPEEQRVQTVVNELITIAEAFDVDIPDVDDAEVIVVVSSLAENLDRLMNLPELSTATCWKHTYGRGFGTFPNQCGPGLEKSGLLCYPPCKEATPIFRGIGPVCWQDCRSDYTDIGLLCAADLFEMYAKESYGRGWGEVLQCGANQENQLGFCHPTCEANYAGVGSVCWRACPASTPYDAGMMCCKDKATCDQKILELGLSPIMGIADLFTGFTDGVSAADVDNVIDAVVDIGVGFRMPICGV